MVIDKRRSRKEFVNRRAKRSGHVHGAAEGTPKLFPAQYGCRMKASQASARTSPKCTLAIYPSGVYRRYAYPRGVLEKEVEEQ